jgi:hypothetical protein
VRGRRAAALLVAPPQVEVEALRADSPEAVREELVPGEGRVSV